MRVPISVHLLRLNSRYVGNRGHVRTANAIAWLIWGPWQCWFGHAVVAEIPLCFRCLREWDSWDEVPS